MAPRPRKPPDEESEYFLPTWERVPYWLRCSERHPMVQLSTLSVNSVPRHRMQGILPVPPTGYHSEQRGTGSVFSVPCVFVSSAATTTSAPSTAFAFTSAYCRLISNPNGWTLTSAQSLAGGMLPYVLGEHRIPVWRVCENRRLVTCQFRAHRAPLTKNSLRLDLVPSGAHP